MPTASIVSPPRRKAAGIGAHPGSGSSSSRPRSRPDRRDGRLIRRGAVALLAGLGLLTGCLSRPAVVTEDLLDPIGSPTPWLPRAADLDAARLARLALATRAAGATRADDHAGQDVHEDPEFPAGIEQATRRLVESAAAEQRQDKLVPLALDLRNATLDDAIAYRKASRTLRKRGDLDPRLRSRLDRVIADDPLRLARRRLLDGWHRLWARTFNAVSEPLGSAAITGFVLAPFQLANSAVHYFAEFSNAEPLSVTGRQALALRKQFLAEHPETRLTEELERKVAAAQIELEQTLALRRVRAAETALDRNRAPLARVHAEAALDVLAAHPEENARLRRRAVRRLHAAQERIETLERLRTRSIESTPTPPALLDLELRIASRLLAEPARHERLEPLLDAYVERGGSIDRRRYVQAIAQKEQGFRRDARKALARTAALPDARFSMARHARTLLEDDWQNPHRAFERLKRKGRREELAWRLAGEWINRPRYPNLPTPLAYLIDTPTIAITIALAPIRALLSPLTGGVPDFDRAAALAGYRYLLREPGGEAQRSVLDWLYEYETGKQRWGRALRLADLIPDFDSDERATLVEKTAAARLAHLDRLKRRDTRSSLLTGVAREFPDSEKGHEAGLRARQERQDASPQSIRISRGFLEENPDVAYDRGIGLNPRLLNEDLGDGELHPEGVVLRGGRVLEIRLIAEGKDDEDPPESRIRPISEKRLARIASGLDQAVQRNGLVDADARFDADANRDVYLERARLGLTDTADGRPTAESTFVYQSLRERYGMVRGRDSVLPFDLVFRGSLGDLSLGAFPRWRPPRETPDAFLYR